MLGEGDSHCGSSPRCGVVVLQLRSMSHHADTYNLPRHTVHVMDPNPKHTVHVMDPNHNTLPTSLYIDMQTCKEGT